MSKLIVALWSLALVAACLAPASAAGGGAHHGPAVADAGQSLGAGVYQTGPGQVVFDHSSMACDPANFEDAPPRAFRDPSGRVQLILSHGDAYAVSPSQTRRMIGTSLDNVAVEPDCRVIHYSHDYSYASTFENREWLVSPYVLPDGRVYGLVHNEFHAYYYGRCTVEPFPPSGFPNCWYNAITLAYSPVGAGGYGAYYAPVAPVATIPYRYREDATAFGYFQPSNIVRKGSFYYSLFRAFPDQNPDHQHQDQLSGTCVMRTGNLAGPHSWRAWDGSGFNVSFKNPYDTSDGSPAAEHVCKPVSRAALAGMAASLTFNSFFNAWMIVDASRDGAGQVPGVYYSLSTDFIHWSPRKLLLRESRIIGAGGGSDACAPPAAGNYPAKVGYPALLDSDSADANFTTADATTWLYLVRFNCGDDSDRDLIRIPIGFG
jgi:hypothetical protein